MKSFLKIPNITPQRITSRVMGAVEWMMIWGPDLIVLCYYHHIWSLTELGLWISYNGRCWVATISCDPDIITSLQCQVLLHFPTARQGPDLRKCDICVTRRHSPQCNAMQAVTPLSQYSDIFPQCHNIHYSNQGQVHFQSHLLHDERDVCVGGVGENFPIEQSFWLITGCWRNVKVQTVCQQCSGVLCETVTIQNIQSYTSQSFTYCGTDYLHWKLCWGSPGRFCLQENNCECFVPIIVRYSTELRYSHWCTPSFKIIKTTGAGLIFNFL